MQPSAIQSDLLFNCLIGQRSLIQEEHELDDNVVLLKFRINPGALQRELQYSVV